jgi:hypothetical protein
MWQRSADAGILPSAATPGFRMYLEVTSLVFAMPLPYVPAHAISQRFFRLCCNGVLTWQLFCLVCGCCSSLRSCSEFYDLTVHVV